MKKMTSLLFACVAVACLISEIGAASKSSSPTTTPVPDLCQLSGYDVSELMSRDYWVANVTGQPSACVDPADHGNCTYYFAFCQGLHLPETVSATNCNGSAVCQIGHTNTTQTSYSLGMYTDDLRFYQSSDSSGFFMDVFNGSNTTVCTTGISTRVRFQCNESAIWTTRNLTNFITVLAIHDSPNFGCQFEVILQYSGACSQASNHSVSPTHVMPTSTRVHMNHTTHVPHLNTSTHSMHPTASHSTGNHSSTKHPGSTNHHPSSTNHHPGTTSHHVHSTSLTKASSSTKTHPPSSPTSTVPSGTPLPHHHTTPHPHSPTKPATKPTENPLQHKVAGLTAGVVIFALIAFGLVVALVGVVFFFYKRGGGKYSMLSHAE